jgi:hypothetical protein
MGKTVLFFGSEFGGDDKALRVHDGMLGRNVGAKLVKCDSPIDIVAHANDEDIFVVDVVRGLENISVFRKASDFAKIRSATAHDMDLGTFMHVLEGMGWLQKLKIIGLPADIKKEDAIREIERIISSD